MDSPLKEAVDKITDAIKLSGVGTRTIQNYRKEFKSITDSFPYADKDASISYARQLIFNENKSTQHQRRCLLLLVSTLETGKVDLLVRVNRNHVEPQSDIFKKVICDYTNYLYEQDHASSSIRVESCLARKYLIFLEGTGCHSLADATSSSISDFVISLRSSWKATSIGSAMSLFRPFVRFLGREDLIYVAESIKAPRKRAILQVLSKSERDSILDALESPELSCRDRAIMLLAITTGIRACDIIALRLCDIDWEHDCISIIQKKTGNPLVLPVTSLVGNALYDYITTERPDFLCPNVFLRSRVPYGELKGSSQIYNTISKVLKVSGIKTDNRQRGTRMLRHSVASFMLSDGVALSTISAVLGHVVSSSTDVYLTVDAQRLKQCILPLSEEEMA